MAPKRLLLRESYLFRKFLSGFDQTSAVLNVGDIGIIIVKKNFKFRLEVEIISLKVVPLVLRIFSLG